VRRPLRAFWLAALLGAGCASALKEPPPISSLQREDLGPAPASALLQQGEEAFAKRPDPAAVRRAEGLCLAAAKADETQVDGLLCALRAKAWLAEREKGVKDRTELSVSAVQVGQWCLRRDPASAPCKYWLAVALGLQARDRPVTADDGLKRMVQFLRETASEAPLLDEAGPERVLALLLVRAPGWPVGPGDAEQAIPHARRAVELRPDYPPNQLALGEVLINNGDKAGGRAALLRAIELAGAPPWSSDPDAPSWVADARALLPR
jgi:tetratricopeptide (TPR) repeat protein